MDTLKENFNKIAQEARREGAKVELLLSGSENLTLGYSKRKLNKFDSTQSQMAGLRVVLGSSQGYAYTENLSQEALLRAYKEAINNARTLVSTAAQEIPMVKPLPIESMSDLFKPEQISMDKKMEAAKLLEEICLEQDSRVQAVPYSSYHEGVRLSRILNSEGVDQEFKQGFYSGYSYVLAKEGESSKMDGESFFTRSFKDINIEKVAKEGVRKALSRLGAKKLKTGQYPVVIDREQFSTVLMMFSSYLSAKKVHEGTSLFGGKLNQKIASEKFHLIDDPFETRGISAQPFDSEGAPSRKTVLFENGVLRHFLTNLEYAQKLNLPHTANASRSPASSMDISPTNLVVTQGTKSLAELLASHDKVIHLTEFVGGLHAGFKESTGDFSMPAEGFLYENGKVVTPVDQFVVSGNILDLLCDIEDLGNEYVKPGGSLICPDVLIQSLSFAGA